MPSNRFSSGLFQAAASAALLLGFSLAAFGHDGPAVDEAQALEKAIEKAVHAAEPSIASIWVSRSEVYAKLLKDAPPPESPGELGGFDRQEVKKKLEVLFKNPKRLAQEVKKLDLADAENIPESYASGVVISAKGLVLTNFHVVRDAAKIYVRLPGDKGSYANIHAADGRSDLAVLRLLNPDILPLKPIPIGEGEKVQKGHFVVTIANPFAAGFRDGSPGVSWGMVSNLRQRAPNRPSREELWKTTLHHYGTLLQIDAQRPLGCSGGALLNLRGEMIGLTNSLAGIPGGETGGFAIPLDGPMRRIIDMLVRGEEVEYGFLGISFPPMRRPGVQFQQAIAGSPASAAGLQGAESRDLPDTILEVNDFPVQEEDDLLLAISRALAGSKTRLNVRRGFGGQREVTVTLAKLYQPAENFIASKKPPFVHGLRVDWSSVLAQTDRSLMRIPPGVYVREVQPGSAADKAELQNAIITQVNGRSVATPAEFLKAANANGPIELTLAGRDGREIKKVNLD
jgi:S1-C subfamily serine protease